MEAAVIDPNPKLQKVYQYLKKNNAVKSPTYEDFEAKMQDQKTAEKVYNYLKDNGKLKARDMNEFQSSMGLKKKDATLPDGSIPSGSIQETGSPVLESGLTEEQERQRNLQQLATQPVTGEEQPVVPTFQQQVQQQMTDPSRPVSEQPAIESIEPPNDLEVIGNAIERRNPILKGIYDLGRKFISVLKDDLPGAVATHKQINSDRSYEDFLLSMENPNSKEYKESSYTFRDRLGHKPSPEEKREWIAGQEINRVGQDEFTKSKQAYESNQDKKKVEAFEEANLQKAEAEDFLKGIPKTWKEAEGTGGVSSYIGAAIGQGLAQIPAAVVTRGTSGYFLEKADAYNEGVDAIATEMGITPKEVVEKKLDAPAKEVSEVVGLINASLDYFSAGKVLKGALKDQVKKKVQEEILKKGIWQKISKSKGADVAKSAVTEYATEYAQETDTQLGGLIAAGKSPEEAINEVDFGRSAEAGLQGLFAGGGISTAASLGSKNKTDGKAAEQPTAGTVSEQPVAAASGTGAPKVEAVNTDQPSGKGTTEPVAAPLGEPVTQSVTEVPIVEPKTGSKPEPKKKKATKKISVPAESSEKTVSAPEVKDEEIVEEKTVPAEQEKTASKFPVTPDVVEKYVSRVRSPRGRYGAAEGVLDVDLGVKGYSREEKEQFEGEIIKSFIEGDLPKKAFGKKELLDADLLPKSAEVNIKPIPQKVKPKASQQSLQDNITDDSELRPAMTGVYRDADNKVMVATDGYVLVKIPDETIEKSEIVHMSKAGTEDHRRVINEKFPDYNSVVPDANPIKEKASVQEWLDKTAGVSRANKFFERRYGSSGSSGKAIAGRASFGDMDIYFDPEMMQRVLTVFAENGVKDVTMEFHKPNKAILLKGNGITGLVMPIQGMDIPYKTFISRDLSDAERLSISKTDLDRLENHKKELLVKYKAAKSSDALDRDYYQRKLDAINEEIAGFKPKKNAPKTEPTKSPDVPATSETTSESVVEQPEQESKGKRLEDVGKDDFVAQTIKATGLDYNDMVMWRQSADRLPSDLDTDLHRKIIEDAISRGEEPMIALSIADQLTASLAFDPNFDDLRNVTKRGGDVSESVKFFEENGITVPQDIKDYKPKFKKGDRVVIDSKRRTDNGAKAEIDMMLPDGRISIKIFRGAKPSFSTVNADQIKSQVNSPIATEKATNPPKKEQSSQVNLPKSESKVDQAKAKLADRARKVKDKYNDLYNNENLGAIYDPKARAKKYYDFHRELVLLAKDAIALGVVTVEEYGQAIGRKVDDFLTRAFEDAQRETKGEPVAVKSQKFFETIESSSEQKEKLSQAIETDQTDRSDYVKRRIQDTKDNKTFKKGIADKGDYTVQSMELANSESDKLISDLQNELGDKAGLIASFSALKDNQIPALMEGPLASKLMLKMQTLRMNKMAVEVLDWLQEGGRDSARRLASLQATASPESTVSRMFAGLEKSKQDALGKPFKGNQSYLDILKKLQDDLAAMQRKYDDLLENGTFDKSMLPEPESPSQSQTSKEIIKKAKSLRAEGMSDLNKFFKKNRGQANMGAPLDPDLFKALAKILKSYLLEFEGNIIAGYEKFRKDVSSQYPITAADLDQAKADLLNANKDVIQEFKAKKQLQVIDKMLAPEGKETPDQRKKRRETAKKILKDFNDGVTTDELAENFADIAGFETVSPENTAKIVEMTNRYAQYNAEGKNELSYKAWYDLMMFLEDLGLQQRSAHETILDLWYTGVLSGLTTIARSIKGSLLSTSNFTATRLMANPKVAPLAIASMIKGLQGAGGTYRHIMASGKTTVKLQDFSPRMVRLTDRLWDKSFGDLKARDKFLKAVYALPTFMYRNIIAFDQILKDSVAEGNIAVFEFNSTKEEKTLSDRLKKTQERLQNLRNDEVRALVEDEISVMKKAGEEIPTGYKDRRFRELKNEMRNADHVKRAVEDAARASLVSHPVGTLGHLYSYWERMMEITDTDPKVTQVAKYGLRSIFPFMRIGFNYVNAGLDFTPVGFYRALKQSIWTKDGVRPVEGFERREYFVRASIGLSTYTLLLASMFDWDEEEGGFKLKPKKDRWIEIYGPLTGKWWEHDDVATDAKPWSVRLKNPFTGEWSGTFSYADNPIGFMLAPLGITHDEIMFDDFKAKAEKKELKHDQKNISYLIGAGIHGTFRYAMDQSFNQGLNTIGNLMAPESPEKFGQEVENLVLRPTQGFYPSIYRQLYDQYRAASDTPEKQANHWYEKPAKLAPFVDGIVKNEKYDIFGYPVIRDLNTPLIPDFVLRAAKENLDYKEKYPEWKLLHKFEEVVIGGSFLPPTSYQGKELTDEQKDEYSRMAGLEMRRLVNSHYEALNNMTAEKLQGRLLKYKSTARKRAERQVLKGND